jgi:hypothetical protein
MIAMSCFAPALPQDSAGPEPSNFAISDAVSTKCSALHIHAGLHLTVIRIFNKDFHLGLLCLSLAGSLSGCTT